MYRRHHHIALFSLAMLAMMLLAAACYTAFWLPVRIADVLADRYRGHGQAARPTRLKLW